MVDLRQLTQRFFFIPALFGTTTRLFVASKRAAGAIGKRNLLIVLTSPLKFFIYCSIFAQFRLTVRQLFSSRLFLLLHKHIRHFERRQTFGLRQKYSWHIHITKEFADRLHFAPPILHLLFHVRAVSADCASTVVISAFLVAQAQPTLCTAAHGE
ncbi:hypothetical protein niasHT_029156 [Heterodera trifolii]|uniref:Secreted protein n=1 Tax=Heterodera trifolii TaxID=157864 RepID=A0ABD2JYK0_9BILA